MQPNGGPPPTNEDRWTDRVLLVLFPLGLARLAFGSYGVYPLRDGTFRTVSRLRSLALGLVLIGSILQSDPSALWTYPNAVVNATTNTTLIAMVVIVATLIVVALLVDSRWRRTALIAMSRPTIRIGGLLAFLFVGQALGWWHLGIDPPPTRASPSEVTLTSALLSIVVLILMLLLITFLIGTLYFIGRDLFALADAHPKLVPIVSVLLVGAALAFDIAAAAGWRAPFLLEVDQPAIPADVAFWLRVASVVTAVALSVWQFRLVGKHGFHLVRGEWR
ncbi:hypothetical protein [Nakamurella sp.]|uniref:hypothetical protein n=1 Tax=Nakamurella sp. TaxID=1869182 RepID=UPI003B3AA44B